MVPIRPDRAGGYPKRTRPRVPRIRPHPTRAVSGGRRPERSVGPGYRPQLRSGCQLRLDCRPRSSPVPTGPSAYGDAAPVYRPRPRTIGLRHHACHGRQPERCLRHGQRYRPGSTGRNDSLLGPERRDPHGDTDGEPRLPEQLLQPVSETSPPTKRDNRLANARRLFISGGRRPGTRNYQPMTMFDSMAFRACSRSDPVSCM